MIWMRRLTLFWTAVLQLVLISTGCGPSDGILQQSRWDPPTGLGPVVSASGATTRMELAAGLQETEGPVFIVSPNQVTEGGTATLFWRIPSCARVRVSNKANEMLFDKQAVCTFYFDVKAKQNDVFTLTAWNAAGSEIFSKSGHVTIVKAPLPPPVIETFQVMPYSISKGQTTDLTWKVSRAIRVELVSEGGSAPSIAATQFQGRMVIAPSESTMYVLNAFGADGQMVSAKTHLEIDTPLFPPKIEQWYAAQTNLNWGESTALAWKVSSDAVKVEMLDPRFGVWPLSGTQGSITVTPDRTSQYTITAYSKEGISASESLTLNVVERVPQIDAFDASTVEIEEGQKTTLNWGVQFAQKVAITTSDNQKFDNLPLQGTKEVSPRQTTTYQLNAYDRFGRPVTRVLTITVVPPERQPSIAFFTSSASFLVEGETATLQWRVSDCGKVLIQGPFINNGAAEMACDANIVVGPRAPQGNYTLTAFSSRGRFRADAQVVIQVQPRPLPPVIVSFYGSPGSIMEGEAASIVWQVNDCERVYLSGAGLSGGQYDCVGSQTVYLYGTSTYTLTAVGRNGNLTATQTISVIVNPRPQPPIPYPQPYPYPGPYPQPYPGPYPQPYPPYPGPYPGPRPHPGPHHGSPGGHHRP